MTAHRAHTQKSLHVQTRCGLTVTQSHLIAIIDLSIFSSLLHRNVTILHPAAYGVLKKTMVVAESVPRHCHMPRTTKCEPHIEMTFILWVRERQTRERDGGGGELGGGGRERQPDRQTNRQTDRQTNSDIGRSAATEINLQHPIPKSNKQITKHEPHIEMIFIL